MLYFVVLHSAAQKVFVRSCRTDNKVISPPSINLITYYPVTAVLILLYHRG